MTALSPVEAAEVARFGIHDADVLAGMVEHADEAAPCIARDPSGQCVEPATHGLVCTACKRHAGLVCDTHAAFIETTPLPVSHKACGVMGRHLVRVVPL